MIRIPDVLQNRAYSNALAGISMRGEAGHAFSNIN